ncbi:MAG: PAS-domain containing protein [Proteobacteria bacterium]|nr:PAS-domain containing protein [Pseudomonadota bacterium]
MHTTAPPPERPAVNTRAELLLLLVASIACAIVLTASVAERSLIGIAGNKLAHVLALAVTSGAMAVALGLLWRSTHVARRLGRRRDDETAELRRRLAAAEAILKAEPQVLVHWQHGQGVRVAVNTLTTVPGLPDEESQLLKFGQWLEPEGAHDLKAGLDTLFAVGRPFNLLLRTIAGGHVEADGRVSGGRAILRLRDVAGSRRDLARIMDQHRQLARDISLSRSLLNALPMPVWLRGGDGRIVWVNKAYVAAVEAADENEVREKQIELLESRQREDLRASFASTSQFHKRLALNIAGTRRPHDVVALRSGEALAAAAIDVTAAESAQGELDRQIVAYDRTLDRVATAVAIFGPDRRLTFANVAFQRLWGLDPKWLAMQPTDGQLLDRLHEAGRLPEVVSRPEQQPDESGEIQPPEAVNYKTLRMRVLAAARGETAHEEGWYLPDGRTLHVTIEPRPDGGATQIFDDVTERLALESRFNAMIDVQRETLDHLKEGVAVFGTDGRLRLYNQAFERIWKLSRPMLSQQPHIHDIAAQTSVLVGDSDSWASIAHVATEISDLREPVEGQMARADQSVIDYAALPLPDGGTLVSFADVTVSKRYERALIERNEALVAADRLKSQFISHVSYELRTPLTNIIGFSELLESPRTGTLNEKQREYLTDVGASSRQLLSIIDDILDLANMDAGALELKVAPIKVRPVIESAATAVRERAHRARIRLDVTVQPDIDTMLADEARIRQIFYNILSNAVGFSSPGSRVSLTTERQNGMIAFKIRDEGVGIPKEEQRAVLERFVSRSQGSKHRGVGLGLPVAKSLVELHGGRLLLESEPGHGTTVTVLLPEAGVPERLPHKVARAADRPLPRPPRAQRA